MKESPSEYARIKYLRDHVTQKEHIKRESTSPTIITSKTDSLPVANIYAYFPLDARDLSEFMRGQLTLGLPCLLFICYNV